MIVLLGFVYSQPVSSSFFQFSARISWRLGQSSRVINTLIRHSGYVVFLIPGRNLSSSCLIPVPGLGFAWYYGDNLNE